MADKTGIGWTDATWNPVTGCDKISEGCDNCYALTQAARLKKAGVAEYQNDGDPRTSGPGFAIAMHPHRLDQPLRWTKPRLIFVNSMSDLFHPGVSDQFIHDVFEVMGQADRHIFQVLTKRSQRLMHMADSLDWHPNVWIGTTVETDRYGFRAQHLSTIDAAAVRFISAEPLLGPLPNLPLDNIDWLIVGGESGLNHRPVEKQWIIDLKSLADAAGTAFYFKQWGGRTSRAGGCALDGVEYKSMPAALTLPTPV